jgi:hypothetical protein
VSAATPSVADRRAIADVVDHGLWALDTRDLEAYLSTFWPDAVFSEAAPDGTRSAWHGIDDIRAVSAARVGPPTGRQHRLSNPLYTPLAGRDGVGSADGWTVWWYWMTSVRHPADGTVTFEMSGYLRDEVERRSGEWRLLGRHLDGWPDGLQHPLRAAAPAPAGRPTAAPGGAAISSPAAGPSASVPAGPPASAPAGPPAPAPVGPPTSAAVGPPAGAARP